MSSEEDERTPEREESEKQEKKWEVGSKKWKRTHTTFTIVLALAALCTIESPLLLKWFPSAAQLLKQLFSAVPLLKWLSSAAQGLFKSLLLSSPTAMIFFAILIIVPGILLLHLLRTTNPQQTRQKNKFFPWSSDRHSFRYSRYEYFKPTIAYLFVLLYAWFFSWVMDLSLSNKEPPAWFAPAFCICVPAGFLFAELASINAVNFNHAIGLSLNWFGWLLIVLGTVIPGKNTAIIWAGLCLVALGFVLWLCSGPRVGGWVDRLCTWLALLHWKNALLTNHASVKGIEMTDSGSWSNPSNWDSEARMFLMDLTSKRKIPLSGIVAVTTSLGAIWSSLKEASNQAQKTTAQSQGAIAQLLKPIADLLNHNTGLIVGIVTAIIVLSTIWQIARSYYWRWLESMRRKIRVEQEKSKQRTMPRRTSPYLAHHRK